MIIPITKRKAAQKEELSENLKSLLADIESEEIPFIGKVEAFAIA